jgi:hypothetical protein
MKGKNLRQNGRTAVVVDGRPPPPSEGGTYHLLKIKMTFLNSLLR